MPCAESFEIGWESALKRAEPVNAELLAAIEAMLRIHGTEEYRNGKPIPCPCDGCKLARAALAKGGQS